MQAHWPDFLARREVEDRPLPEYVREEFETYLRCGVLEHGFLRVVCEQCRAERLVAFSCKKRGFCPSCGARRMAESARHLVEEVFGPRPVRQWVLSFPYPLRFLFASKPEAIGPVLVIVHRVIAGWLADQAGVPRDTAQCGAVTLIQRFGSALNLNVHFHMLWLDGVYDANVEPPRRKPRLRRARAPTSAQLTQLANTIAHRVCRHLSRRGWLEGEDESVFLSDSAAGDDGMDALRMSSIRSSTGSHRLRTRQHLRPFLGGHHTQGTVLPTQRATAELPLALGQQESAILPDATRGLLRRKASPQNTVSVAGRRPRDREHQPVVTNENRSFSMGCQQLSEIIRRRDTVYRCRIIGYTCRCRDSGQAPFDQRIGHAEHWRSRAIGRGVACATRSPTGGYRFYAADMFTTIAVNP